METPKTVLLAIACDLKLSDDEVVQLGPESIESCEKAIELYRVDYTGLHPDKPIILVTACASPDPAFKRISIAQLMRDYCIAGGVNPSHVRVELASTFNTLGEMLACTRHLRKSEKFEKVVICVKWWLSLRCYVLLHFCLKWFCSHPVKITVAACSSENVSSADVVREFFGAIPKNMLRLLHLRLLKKHITF